MVKKRTAFLSSACLLAVLFSGCKKEEAPKESSSKPVIALVMKSLANEFFKTMEDGAKAHHAKHSEDYKLLCNGIRNEQDVNKQIKIINQMIARQVDAIVLAPADSKALVGACKNAIEKGIVVVNIDNKLDEKVLSEENIEIPFVGPDNRKGARLAAAYLASKLQKGDEVAILEGRPGAFNGIQRKRGFEDAMKEAGMEIVTSQSGHWETKPAYNLAEQIYNKHGDELDAVLCANDSMALGAARALRGKDVKIIGFDNISAIQRLIKEGEVLCTVDQHAGQIAVYGIKYALQILETNIKPADKETPVDLITAETLK